MWRHRLSISRKPDRVEQHRREVQHTGREDPGARRGLVVRHLRVEAGTEQVRDQCEHLGPRRRERCRRVDLDPEAADLVADGLAVLEPRALEEPRRRGDVRDVERSLARAVVVGAVLHTAEPRLGPADGPPLRVTPQDVAILGDLPEEVVRGEEDQPPAEVAEALDHVVGVLGHVLAVAREDDEVVLLPELVAAREQLEVVVREDVRVATRLLEPAEEREVVAEETRRHASFAIGPVEHDRRLTARVPRVAPPVPVRVVEVVGLPGVRRENDGDAILAGLGRPEHERSEPDPPVVGLEPCRVEPARPLTGLNDDRVARRALARPVDRDGIGHLDAGHLVASQARVGAVADAQERELERRRIGLDTQRHSLLGQVRPLRECRLDAEHPHDGSLDAGGRGRTPAPVCAATAVCLHREPHDVRADRGVGRRTPRQGVVPGTKRGLRRPADVASVDPHPDRVEAHACPSIEVEHDACDVASRNSGCDRHEQRPVAGEATGSSADRQGADGRRRRALRDGEARDHAECAQPSEGGAQQPPSRERLEHVGIVVRRAAGIGRHGEEGLPPGGPPHRSSRVARDALPAGAYAIPHRMGADRFTRPRRCSRGDS